ncbi:efflux RND transporter periplasmic adaptor subunit [Desulfomonile tiedjei]|uniref:Multidrug resistance efflux pump n=1 Tax=Desulfomonile tiedjei (strain ATCC 49306 / DSM 6799 / DCB-1) TaxID=706587 RepID=I4C118_DESTA|nr:HlyD family efflux transporter periplasmic adaptor subunit [Desulfomonile tiedjei]AFM23259.1 multidrug resistance efflux pump [Desulfomonile tiedjei DSM 6799]
MSFWLTLSFKSYRTRLMCIPLLLAFLITGCASQPVVTVSAHRGKIQETFTEPARTRLSRTYPISTPVEGRVMRIALEPKDKVERGQLLVQYDLVPFEEAVKEARARVLELKANLVVHDDNRLENTALVEAKSAIQAAEEALKASQAQVAAEKARWERADKELKRMTQLLAQQAIPQTKMDDVSLAAETALIELKQQEFYLAAMKAIVFAVHLGPLYVTRYLERKELERSAIEHQLAQAAARLALAEHNFKLTNVRSPVTGLVLEKHEEGDSTLQAGKQLLLLGDLKDLEVVADVLTQDALRLSAGTQVQLQPAIAAASIPGKVKRIDPSGFTKLSSLGVEQQRVNVIVSFAGDHQDLGVGYRVQARFITGSKPDALIVSRFSVMQEPDGSYYVLKVEDGRLQKQKVQLGLRNDLELEIVSGLTEKDVIVARPDTTMEVGSKVSSRER